MRCAHAGAVPVESSVTGETLAALCPDCDDQLPAAFLDCAHANVIETPTLGEPPGFGICNDCGTSAWYPGTFPQLIDPRGAFALTAEDVEALAARFRAAQAGPHRIVFMPTIASLSAPTTSEIEARR